MKTNNTINNCRALEQKALRYKGMAMDVWIAHAEGCANCKARLNIILELNRAQNGFSESLGSARFEVITKAVSERDKELKIYPILKYAAIAVIILITVISFYSINSFVPKVENQIIKRAEKQPNSNNNDLAWDDLLDTSSLKIKMNRLKRKVYYTGLRNGDLINFRSRCKSIKKRAGKLKFAKQI